MVVALGNARNDATGDNSTPIYPFTFLIHNSADLLITQRATTGVETTLVLTTDYTVPTTAVNNSAGGNITLVAGNLATGVILTIRRRRDVAQATIFRNLTQFFGNNHEDALDRLAFLCQQINEQTSRSIKLPETVVGLAALTELPANAADRISRVIGFDATGNVLNMVSNVPTSGVSATAFMETVLDDSTAAEARETLGAYVRGLFEARMSGTTGVAIPTTDTLTVQTIYLTPYKGELIGLYDGTNWNLHRLNADISITTPATTGTNYDLYVYDVSGTLTLQAVAWTNDTTRATALATQDGVLVQTGSLGRRYVGSFRTTAVSGDTEDSRYNRFMWNYYNRVERTLRRIENTNTWTYTLATIRQVQALTTNQVHMIIGVSEDPVLVDHVGIASNGAANVFLMVGVGLDSTTTNSALIVRSGESPAAGILVSVSAHYKDFPGIGYHFLSMLEYSGATGTTTWRGDNGSPSIQQSGIFGYLKG